MCTSYCIMFIGVVVNLNNSSSIPFNGLSCALQMQHLDYLPQLIRHRTTQTSDVAYRVVKQRGALVGQQCCYSPGTRSCNAAAQVRNSDIRCSQVCDNNSPMVAPWLNFCSLQITVASKASDCRSTLQLSSVLTTGQAKTQAGCLARAPLEMLTVASAAAEGW